MNATDPFGKSAWTKLAKFVIKGGDVGATFAGSVEDFGTLTNSDASGWARAGAGISLASELAPVGVRDIKEAGGAIKKFFKRFKRKPKSPKIDPKDIANKTPTEIDQIAQESGLIPKGPNPKTGQGSYTDPNTGKQRVLCHSNCDNPHAHVNDADGNRLDIDGNKVPNESPEAHLPIKPDPE